jgi:hypothetical protein
MACFHGLELRSVFGSVPGLSVRHPLSTAERSVRQTLISQAAHVLPRAFKASGAADGRHLPTYIVQGARCAVSPTKRAFPSPISAFAYRRVAHVTSFFLPRARLSLPSLPPVLMAGGAFIWNCA